jgi:beta-N-acetylhexosaminidase
VQPERLHSLTFTDLQRHLSAPAPTVTPTLTITTPIPATPIPTPAASPTATAAITSTDRLISSANWIVFAMQDANTDASASADALRQFLRQSEPKLRNKNIIVFAFGAPYYLDTTEISKLTAYYGLYSKMPAFLEIAVRTLFQEITPQAASPVSIAGVNYDLISVLEPDPNQVIQVKIGPLPAATKGTPTPVGIAVGGTLRLATSDIVDRNGHPVPDGTPVEFRLFYPADAVELPRVRTVTLNGVAEASTVLERTGQLNVTVSAGAATRSTTLQVTIQSDKPALISTVVPTPIPTPTATPVPTATATETPAPTATPSPEPTSTAPAAATLLPPRGGRWSELALSLLVLFSLASVTGVLRGALGHSPTSAVRLSLWLVIGGLIGYILHVQNVLPAPSSDLLPALWVSPIITVLTAAIAGALCLAISPTPHKTGPRQGG